MYIRKLVKSGISSFTLALPKNWIEKHELKKGDLLYVEEYIDDTLIISTNIKQEKKEKKELVINTEKKEISSLIRELRAAYLNDYFRIVVKGKNLKDYKSQIKSTIKDLVALEPIDEDQEKVVARNFLNISDVSIKDIFRRIDNITRSMLIDMISCLKNEDVSKEITERDADVNRLVFLVLKILKTSAKDSNTAKAININGIQIIRFWEAILHIEKIADEAKRNARLNATINKNKGKIMVDELEELQKTVLKQYEDVMKAFYKEDIALSDKVSSERFELMKKFDEYFEKNRGLEIADICSKMKSVLSQINDISKIVRYLKEREE
ncbi:MAG: PhoU domain-containing protein [Nanoarchaeota archaeon]|nr:hypothetical protein [Nanoarchaeota archaeon]MBU1030443.1 hypothetical protein [Nanoarchaeota archaeon]MBU1849774.1 hypothetical protein [Nanoarchaeota archaeon]